MALPVLKGYKIAILATNGFEQSELMDPMQQLSSAGAEVTVISPEKGEIRGWREDDWGASVKVDLALEKANVDDYDSLILPGGQMNPDILRANADAVAFVREFAETGKPLAAICHAPWLLVEADLAEGRTMTSYGSIRTDLVNAGALVVDRAVSVDGNIITSRSPEDLLAFNEAIANALVEMRQVEATVE
ncbi:MAG: type 1 glutamine amidotransferase [Sphingomonadaceae bacterium]|nr:type 1 glutamine amidotransferase [Sphingomonadaceae bacterium]